MPNSLSAFEESKDSQATTREENTFLFFGRLSQEKGVDTLIEALALLPEENKLLIAGDGPDRKRLEKLTQEKKMVSRVTFFGSLSHN